MVAFQPTSFMLPTVHVARKPVAGHQGSTGND